MFCIVVQYDHDDGDPSDVQKVYGPYPSQSEAHAAIPQLSEDWNDADADPSHLSWDVYPIVSEAPRPAQGFSMSYLHNGQEVDLTEIMKHSGELSKAYVDEDESGVIGAVMGLQASTAKFLDDIQKDGTQ